jgi:hypothetical protein
MFQPGNEAAAETAFVTLIFSAWLLPISPVILQGGGEGAL